MNATFLGDLPYEHVYGVGRGLVFTDKLEVAPSRIAGRGLFARDVIARRSFLGEYTGKVSEWTPGAFIGDWTMRFGKQLRNARRGGNDLRFINHCGDARPNVMAVGFLFFAADWIEVHDELTLDYGWDFPVNPELPYGAYDFERVVRMTLKLGLSHADLSYVYADSAFAMLEHLVHEVGHAISLEVPIHKGVSAVVGNLMERMPGWERTANEAMVLVATMRALGGEAFKDDFCGQAQDQGVQPEQWLAALQDDRGEVAALGGKLRRFMHEHEIARGP